MVAGVEAELLERLAVFILAGGVGVGVGVAKVGRFPYTTALLLAGLGISVLGVDLDIELSHDMILLVLLPPLLFEGAGTMVGTDRWCRSTIRSNYTATRFRGR